MLRIIIKLNLILLLLACYGNAYSQVAGQPEGRYLTTFVLKSIPDNTPHDASLYLSGEFNDWNAGHPAYKLMLEGDGLYRLTVRHNLSTFEYKITRGNWLSVEARQNGRAIPNRTFNQDEDQAIVSIKVHNWEDLASGTYSPYVLLLLLAAFQGLILVVAINSISNNNKSANRLLSVLILIISVSVLSRVATIDRETFQTWPKLLLVPDALLFLYGPLFLMYINQLLKLRKGAFMNYWLHFVPVVALLVVYMPYILLDNGTFIYRVLDRDLHKLFAIVGIVALGYNAWYWNQCWHILKRNSNHPDNNLAYERNVRFLRTTLMIKAMYLVLWGVAFFNHGIGFVIGVDMLPVTELFLDIIWLLVSCIIFCLGYFAISQPELFRRVQAQIKYKDSPIENNELEVFKHRLVRLMEEDKVFMDPELTLASLAHQLHTNTHTMSRVINEGFDKSFYHYINDYRVQEFTRLITLEENQQESLLAVALKVGFNSKTTFNRAFKKLMGTTPRLYLKDNKE